MPLTLDHPKGYFQMTNTGHQTQNKPHAAPIIRSTNSVSPPRVENDFCHFQKISTGIRIGKAWSWSPSEGSLWLSDKEEENVRAHSFAREWPCLGGKTLPQVWKMRKPRLIIWAYHDPKTHRERTVVTRPESRFSGIHPKELLSGQFSSVWRRSCLRQDFWISCAS